jgi:hypothetical protein
MVRPAMKTGGFALALAVLAALWTWQRLAAARLGNEIVARQIEQRDFAELQREHARLQAMQPTPAEWENLQHAAAERSQVQRDSVAQPDAAVHRAPALALGEWSAAREWQNQGDLAPHAAVETALWAAAGGDIATLKHLLSLTGPAREEADALLARLPADARVRYGTPDDLVAAFTIKNIPVGSAQLVWFNQRGPDDATACLFLQNPSGEAGRVDFTARQTTTSSSEKRDREPPQAADSGKTSETYLSLHRDADGWRLVVPPIAVARIAQELGAASGDRTGGR